MALAEGYCEDVEFSPMDATRADVEFTAEVCAIAVAEGAGVINIPDTVGYTTPEEYRAYFERLYELRAGAARACALSVHCHDDLGLAVANSFAGVLAGARQVECAVNGIGERAGNCSLEEIVMLLRTRARRSRPGHGARDTGSWPGPAGWSRGFTGYVGPAEQGDRRAKRLRARVRDPPGRRAQGADDVRDHGRARRRAGVRTQIVLGKHSGRHALKDALEQLGFLVEGNALNQAFKRFKEIADKKKQVTALDLEAIVSDEMREARRELRARLVRGRGGDAREPRARVGGHAARPARRSGARPEATDRWTPSSARSRRPLDIRCELSQYTVSAVGEGDDALGEVTVMLRAHGRLASGQGVATDIIEASAHAYVRALSNALEGAAVREAEEVAADAASQPPPPGP